MLLASRVAARFMLGLENQFLLKNPHKVLHGETIFTSKIPEYERDVQDYTVDYANAKSHLDSLPSGREKGMAGKALKDIGVKGRKARMRLEVAKAMRAKGILKAEFGG